MAVITWQSRFLNELDRQGLIQSQHFDRIAYIWATAKALIYDRTEERVRSLRSWRSVVSVTLEPGVEWYVDVEGDLISKAHLEEQIIAETGISYSGPPRSDADTWPEVFQEHYPRYLAMVSLAMPLDDWRSFEKDLLDPPAFRLPSGWITKKELVAELEWAVSHPGPRSKKDIGRALEVIQAGIPGLSLKPDLGQLALRVLRHVPSYGS